jgi:hypothetical protein
MMDAWQPTDDSDTPMDGAPTWFRTLQAGLVGMVPGLVLYVIMSFEAVHASDPNPAHAAPREYKKAASAHEVGAPPPHLPVLSRLPLTYPSL